MKDQPTLEQIIWQVVAEIPVGKVTTYGQIARQCGYPGYARYVGFALKKLPEDSTLPWHRVVNAKGEISFPSDSVQYLKQKSLLEQEGIQFQHSRIQLSVYGWK